MCHPLSLLSTGPDRPSILVTCCQPHTKQLNLNRLSQPPAIASQNGVYFGLLIEELAWETKHFQVAGSLVNTEQASKTGSSIFGLNFI